MSTRSTYTFCEDIDKPQDGHKVYVHCDGYPGTEYGGIRRITNAIPFAWELPRFEADEFAAAFVVAAKGMLSNRPGGVRLMSQEERMFDTAYEYHVTRRGDSLYVRVFAYKEKEFEGTLTEAAEHYAKQEEAA